MGKFEIVVDVKRKAKRSWKNLLNAAYGELGMPNDFGTKKVANSSISYLKKAIHESGLNASEIIREITQRKLIKDKNIF